MMLIHSSLTNGSSCQGGLGSAAGLRTCRRFWVDSCSKDRQLGCWLLCGAAAISHKPEQRQKGHISAQCVITGLQRGSGSGRLQTAEPSRGLSWGLHELCNRTQWKQSRRAPTCGPCRKLQPGVCIHTDLLGWREKSPFWYLLIFLWRWLWSSSYGFFCTFFD